MQEGRVFFTPVRYSASGSARVGSAVDSALSSLFAGAVSYTHLTLPTIYSV